MHEILTLRPGHDGALWRHVCRAHTRAPHSHVELELNLTTRGMATYLLGERRYDLRPGAMVWLFPAQGHVLLNETADHSTWIGVFSPRLLDRVCTTPAALALCEPDPPGAFCKNLRRDDTAQLEALFQKIAGLSEGDNPALVNAGLGYALLSAWEAFGRAGLPMPGNHVHPAVEATAQCFKEDPDAASLDTIAREVGLSASRLGRLFREQLGVSVPDYRNAQRLDRFLRLLSQEHRSLSLLEAALEAGWGSYAQFHRVFTQKTGCSPAQYRRHLHGAAGNDKPGA